MLQIDRDREVAYREWIAALLALSAEAKHLPALQVWQKVDGSKSVKKILQRGIDRLQNPPPAPSKQTSKRIAKKTAAPLRDRGIGRVAHVALGQ